MRDTRAKSKRYKFWESWDQFHLADKQMSCLSKTVFVLSSGGILFHLTSKSFDPFQAAVKLFNLDISQQQHQYCYCEFNFPRLRWMLPAWWQCWHPRGPAAPSTSAQRSRRSSAWQCRRQAGHQLHPCSTWAKKGQLTQDTTTCSNMFSQKTFMIIWVVK